MNLFELNNYKLQIQPEAYALLPFKKLWDRDKTKDKKVAMEELAYIYFLVDYTSDFSSILEEEERKKEVIKSCISIQKWAPDKVVCEAIEFYKSRQDTIALRMLGDSKFGIEKLSAYIRNINFDELSVNPKTGEAIPKHDIKKFVDTIKQIPSVLAALNELEDTVKKEKEATKGLRGGRQKGMYAK